MMNSYALTHLCCPTSEDLHTSALCGHWMQSRRLRVMNGNDGWQKSQGILCCQRDLMMMMKTTSLREGKLNSNQRHSALVTVLLSHPVL